MVKGISLYIQHEYKIMIKDLNLFVEVHNAKIETRKDNFKSKEPRPNPIEGYLNNEETRMNTIINDKTDFNISNFSIGNLNVESIIQSNEKENKFLAELGNKKINGIL